MNPPTASTGQGKIAPRRAEALPTPWEVKGQQISWGNLGVPHKTQLMSQSSADLELQG